MKVNINKSRLLLTKNIYRAKIQNFENIIELNHNLDIDIYFGFPLLTSRVKNENFAYILDKVNKKLIRWKGKLLSRAGGVTLVKSVLSSMLIYHEQSLDPSRSL